MQIGTPKPFDPDTHPTEKLSGQLQLIQLLGQRKLAVIHVAVSSVTIAMAAGVIRLLITEVLPF